MSEVEPIGDWIQAWSEQPEDDLDAHWIVVDDALARELASTHSRMFELQAIDTSFGPEQLTRELPNVPEDALADLDEHGLVRVGTQVRPGCVLIGKLSPRGGPPATPEEKLLRAVFGETVGEVRDTSLRCPPGWSGVVREARLEPPGKGELARAQVVVTWDRALVIGDALAIDGPAGRARAVVARIESIDGRGGVVWAGGAGSIRVAKLSMAEDIIHARSIGPYSLVSQQPTGGREQCGGQPLDEGQAMALAERAPWTAWEMFTIKSDSVIGRTRAYESVVRRKSPELAVAPEPGVTPKPVGQGGLDGVFSFFERPNFAEVPEGDAVCQPTACVDILTLELEALAIGVRFSAKRIAARILDTEEIRERSYGEVERPETINYRTFKPEFGGLFCERIFGPVRDYECACGQYKRMKHRGIICESCGVEVLQSKVRRERMAHVALAVPVVHPLFKSEVACLLTLTLAQLRDVLGGLLALDRSGRPTAVDTEGARTCGEGVHAALEALDLEVLGDSAEPATRTLARRLREHGIEPRGLMLQLVPVLPPDLRPIVPLSGGRFATSDLNDLYRRVLNRNNRTARLIELDAPQSIVQNESRQLQEAVDQLFINERTPKPVKGPERVLRSLGAIVEQRFTELTERRVDYSGVANLVADPELERGRCRLPMRMARELFKPMGYGIMEARGFVTTIKSAKRALEDGLDFALEAIESASAEAPVLLMSAAGIVAREVELWDAPAVAVDPVTARLLAGSSGAARVCVHLPLTDAAKLECRELADISGFEAGTPAIDEDAWLSRAVFQGEGLARVQDAVLEGQGDEVELPVLRAALGRGPA